MQTYLEDVIEDYLGEKIHHPDILANLILNEIELRGMLPPPVEIELQRPLSDAVCSEFSVYYNTEDIYWEPEDEV